MARRPEYQRLLNSKQWRELRAWYMRLHPLCERCIEEGYIRSAVDCHHIIPVESAKTLQEMERLAFDPNNLRALCIPCHVKTHKEMGKNTKEQMAERRQVAFERWKARMEGQKGDSQEDTPKVSPNGGHH